jgi:hypothetical protein
MRQLLDRRGDIKGIALSGFGMEQDLAAAARRASSTPDQAGGTRTVWKSVIRR